MSGTSFMGLIVETWTGAALPPVIKAVARHLEATQDTSRPDAFELVVHCYKGAAWLEVWSAMEEPSSGLTREALLLPVAKATGSPVWLYQYEARYELVLTITRVLPSGGRATTFTMDVTDKAFRKRAKGQAEDAYTRVQDAAAAEIIKTVPWTIKELRSGVGDYGGPPGVQVGESQTVQLAPHITPRAKPAPPPRQEGLSPENAAWLEAEKERIRWRDGVAQCCSVTGPRLLKAVKFFLTVHAACQEPDLLELEMCCAPIPAARALGSVLVPLKDLAETLADAKLTAIPALFSRKQAQRLKRIQAAPSSLSEFRELIDVAEDLLEDERMIWFTDFFADMEFITREDGKELATQAVLLLLTLRRLQQLIPLAQPFLS
jgi:hypothetical protein